MELQNHFGKWLTNAEILLSRVFETKHEERAEELRAKRIEREIMAQRSRSILQASEITSKPKKVIVTDLLEQVQKESEQSPSVPSKPPSQPPSQQQPISNITTSKKDEVLSPNPINNNDLVENIMKSNEKKTSSDTIIESTKPIKIMKKRNILNETDLDIITTPIDSEEPFSNEYMLSETIWQSNTLNAISQQFLLPEFSYDHKQTLALKLTIPNNSKSWSLNICPGKDYHNNNILLHFNPRYNKRQLIMNDKQGTWGNGRSISFTDIHTSKNNGLLAKEIDLVIQIRSDGFYIFANNMFNSFFLHRRNPTATSSSSSGCEDEDSVSKQCKDLKLIVNAKDANGKVQDVILNKVWWGPCDHNKLPLTGPNLSKIQKIAAEESALLSRVIPFEARSIMVQGLPLGVYDLVECQALEYTLNEVFAEVAAVEDCSVVPGQGYAFLRFASAEMVEIAINEYDGAEIVLTKPKEGAPSTGDEQEGSVLALSKMLL